MARHRAGLQGGGGTQWSGGINLIKHATNRTYCLWVKNWDKEKWSGPRGWEQEASGGARGNWITDIVNEAAMPK